MRVEFAPFGSATPAEIAEFERRYRVSLLDDYRAMLAASNGGLLKGAVAHVEGPDEDLLLEVVLGLGLNRSFSLQNWLDEYRDEMPLDSIIVALGAGTFIFILKTQGDDRGVYCWDHAHAFPESSKDEGNTYRVARTFSEFIDSLTTLGEQSQ